MLVLSRKPKESIVINGNVTVSVLRVDNDNVRIGIEAPMEVPRNECEEIYNEISKNNRYSRRIGRCEAEDQTTGQQLTTKKRILTHYQQY